MNTINENHLVPSEWSEISQSDQLHIFRLWRDYTHEKISLSELKLRIFLKLARVTVSIKTLMGIRLSQRFPYHPLVLRAEDISRNIQALYDRLFGFVINDDGNLALPTVENLLPEFRILFWKFRTPQDLFENLTFGQFRKAYDAMMDFMSNGNPEALNYAISVLFLQKGYRGNPSKILKLLPGWKRDYIFNWFFRTVEYIQNEDINIGAQVVNFSELFPKKSSSNNTSNSKNLGWTSVLFQISEKGTFGIADQVDQTMFMDIMLLLLEELNKSKDIK